MHTVSFNHPDSHLDSRLSGSTDFYSTDFSSANSDRSHCRAACYPSDALASRDISDSDVGFSAELSAGSYPGASPDAQLIARVLKGDTRAYEEFVERDRRFVYALLRRRDLSAQDCDDIYQDLYARLWQHDLRGLRRWQATGMREFKPYLSAVLRRLISDHYRARRKEIKVVPLPPHLADGELWNEEVLDFDGILLYKEQIDILRQAIARLSTRDADIICRRYFAEQSYQEIGAALGMTTDNVGVTLAHIRKRLRKHLTTLGIEVFEEIIAKRETASKARRRKK